MAFNLNPEGVPEGAITASNRDASCGHACTHCNFRVPFLNNAWEEWFPIAVLPAPFTGGVFYDRPWAIVKQCPKCFELSWHHGSNSTKRFFEEFYEELSVKSLTP